jgi:hypothetical protein
MRPGELRAVFTSCFSEQGLEEMSVTSYGEEEWCL